MEPDTWKIYEILYRVQSEQNCDNQALETKSTFLFSAIAVLIGLLLSGKIPVQFSVPYYIGLVVLTATLFLLLFILIPREFLSATSPSRVVEIWREGKPGEYILMQIVLNIERAYTHNFALHTRRAKLLRVCFVFTFLGLLAILAGLSNPAWYGLSFS